MKRKSGGLAADMRKLVIAPLLCFGAVALMVAAAAVYAVMARETRNGLKDLTYFLKEMCEEADAGEYRLSDGVLMKGEHALSGNESIARHIGSISDVDVTLFWGDTRIATSVHNPDGTEADGTRAAPEVAQAVLQEGRDFFSEKVSVNGTPYFGYYTPLQNADGTIVGMVFVGKTREDILHAVSRSVAVIFVVMTVIIVAAALICLRYAERMIYSLDQARAFLAEIAHGNIKARIDPGLLERRDEIGEMGQFLLVLQKSMTALISTDPLTGLYNRRSGSLYLEKLVERWKKERTPVCVVIGDIDDFKKINDQYGHQAGDAVLKALAEIFGRHMEGRGAAVRWGGEEFLFIYEGGGKERTLQSLNEMMKEIRSSCIRYAGMEIFITMTFGAAQCSGEEDMEKVLKRADDNLYLGKQSGKNRIVPD